MNTIYKYIIPVQDKVVLSLPIGASILSAQLQGGDISLWAVVDIENPIQERTIRIFGTGHDIESNALLQFISTIQIGALVFHVFLELIDLKFSLHDKPYPIFPYTVERIIDNLNWK